MDQKRLTAMMRGLGSGELKHPRFTREEAAASGGTEHEKLWNFIVSLESPEVHFGGEGKGTSRIGGDASQGGGWLGQLRRMATRYGSDPQELIDISFKFLDKGAKVPRRDAGQRLVDGLFGKDSGIKVREGTQEEAEQAIAGGELPGEAIYSR